MGLKTKRNLSSLRRKEERRLAALLQYEEEARKLGYCAIAGVDEAGRGPLAGPVVAAACILPEGVSFPDINDSKKLSPDERRDLAQQVKATPGIVYGIGSVESLLIDQINILQATFRAMAAAVAALSRAPDYLLVDGHLFPSLGIPTKGIVGGDTLSQSIMAAAILAKEERDAEMRRHHTTWPLYGFDAHKGYGTPDHLAALRRHGPCPIHRMTFRGVVQGEQR
jgi:ribonuclease HII